MTRKEEVGACIKELRIRMLSTLELIERLGTMDAKDEYKELIKETQELLEYIEEYEELDKK